MLRNKNQTKQKIITAVGGLLARDGFAKLGVNALAREAGVDKVLIYRYFDGLPGVLRSYAESTDFWPTPAEVITQDLGQPGDTGSAQIIGDIMVNLARALRNRPLTTEIMAWELVEQNELTNILFERREQWALNIIENYAFEHGQVPADLPALTALLNAAINYLIIRARTTPVFNLVEIDTERGWQRLENMIRELCSSYFSRP